MGESEAFSGIHVLDLTDGFAGALCTMILGDNGAAVRRPVTAALDPRADDRIEPPGMRQWRRSTEIVHGEPGELAEVVDQHLDDADVVVLSTASRMLERLGWKADHATAERLRAARPGLVVCLIDAFGDHPVLGGAPLHDGVVHAACGRMVDCGASFRFGRPAVVASPLASYGASQAAAQAIMAALAVRVRTGTGQVVRTSLVRGVTIFDFWGPDGAPAGGGRPQSELGPTPAIGYAPARTKDGRWLQWANWAPHLLRQMLQLLGLDDVLDDPTYTPLGALPPELAHRVWERVLEATQQRTAAEWMDLLATTGAAGGDIVRTTIEGLDHAQVRYNGDVIEVVDAELGVIEELGPIAQRTRPLVPGARAWVGAQGARASADAAPPAEAADLAAPLAGVVLLEAATMIATPIGSALLADLGARIIKIEPIGGEAGRTLPFIKTLQGKESIAIDIKQPEGREIVHRLAATADMFLHNYRPGVPEKLGIDDASLRRHNPGLVYLYVGGYGKHGPCEKMPAYHPVAGAVCGNAARQAGRGALDAVPRDMAEYKAASLHLGVANEGHPDPVTGALAATVLLTGLAAREQTGLGEEMTTSMLCASAYLQSGDWIRYDGRPPLVELDADLLGTHALERLYDTAEGWLFVGIAASDEWARFVEVVAPHAGVAEAQVRDARFATVAGRLEHDAELQMLVAGLLATRPADEWEHDLLAARVGAVRADRGSFSAFQQRELAAGRSALGRRVTSPGRGEHWRAAPVVDMDGVGEVTGACAAGQHTRAILRELGYVDADVDRLVAAGVVGEPSG